MICQQATSSTPTLKQKARIQNTFLMSRWLVYILAHNYYSDAQKQ